MFKERFLDFNHFGPKEETTIVDSIVIGAERMRRPRTPGAFLFFTKYVSSNSES